MSVARQLAKTVLNVLREAISNESICPIAVDDEDYSTLTYLQCIPFTIKRILTQSTHPQIPKKKEDGSNLDSSEDDPRNNCMPKGFVSQKSLTVGKMVPKQNDECINVEQYYSMDKDMPKCSYNLWNEIENKSMNNWKKNEKESSTNIISSLLDKDKLLENGYLYFYPENRQKTSGSGDFEPKEQQETKRKEGNNHIVMKRSPNEYLRTPHSVITKEINFLNSDAVKPDTIVIYEDDNRKSPHDEIHIEIGNVKRKSVIHDSFSKNPIFGRILVAYNTISDIPMMSSLEQNERKDVSQPSTTITPRDSTKPKSLSNCDYKMIKNDNTIWAEIGLNDCEPDLKRYESTIDMQTKSENSNSQLTELLTNKRDNNDKPINNSYHQSMVCPKNSINPSIEPVLYKKVKQHSLLGQKPMVGGIKHFSTCPVLKQQEKIDEEKEQMKECKKQFQLPCIRASEIFVDLRSKPKALQLDCVKYCLPCCTAPKDPPICKVGYVKPPCRRKRPPRPSYSECRKDRVSGPIICGCAIPRLPPCKLGNQKKSKKTCFGI